MSCISDNMYDNLKITNPKIVSFYQSNPHIDFESVNLSIVEILHNLNATSENPTILAASIQGFDTSPILYPETQKIKELELFLTNLQENMNRLIKSISIKYIAIKTEYIRDLKTAAKEQNARELFSKINQRFFEHICSIFSVIFCARSSNIADKTKVIVHQFNKILIANTDQIFSKTDEASSKIEDYFHNFESNSGHMIQAIIQILTESATVFESRVKQVSESIKKREDPTFTFYYKLIYELNDILHQLPKSEESENAISFEHILSQQFPTASISREPANANEYLLMRENKSAIYIETHDMREHNIGLSEVKQFLKRAIEKNTNSVIVSQYTGITSKPNYHIEIHNNIVVIYLHKLAYSYDSIQVAADMIDSISAKLTDFCSLSENKYSIPKDILDCINREYQQFILQKETIITGFKDQQKYLLTKLDDMRFSTLDKYLSTRYSSCKKQGYNCELCNNFNVGTLKGLAAHKRGCARKLQKAELTFFEDKSSLDTSPFGSPRTPTLVPQFRFA